MPSRQKERRHPRVSTTKQVQQLESQVVSLRAKLSKCIVIQNCGSGLYFRRKGLKTLLRVCFVMRLMSVWNVYLAYSYCLCSSAYNLFKRLFWKFGTTIYVDSHKWHDNKANVIAIITILGQNLGAHLYGSSSGCSRKSKKHPLPKDKTSNKKKRRMTDRNSNKTRV